jgi:hypothetical protein
MLVEGIGRRRAGEPGMMLDGGRAFAFVVAFSREHGVERGGLKVVQILSALALALALAITERCGADDDDEDL